MKYVFAEALADARVAGWGAVLRLIGRELKQLPGSWLREHRRARRGREAEMQTKGAQLVRDDRISGRRTPGWSEALLAALPYLLFGIFEILGSWLNATSVITPENKGMEWLNYAGLASLAGVVLATLILAWRRGWPLWSASWYLFYTMPLLGLLVGLVAQNLDPFSALGQIAGFLIGMVFIAGLLYTITRFDRLRGMLAALPILFLLWMPNLEQTPRHIIPLNIRLGVYTGERVHCRLGGHRHGAHPRLAYWFLDRLGDPLAGRRTLLLCGYLLWWDPPQRCPRSQPGGSGEELPAPIFRCLFHIGGTSFRQDVP